MTTGAVSQIIGRRYLLQNQLGAGGMGAVYLATDRLTGETVALKRVTVSTNNLEFASLSSTKNLTVALAQEFKVLASLRHPHIISVLDYGFDENRQPFFTMELLENAQSIIDFGQDLVADKQVDLLVHMLQALVYLHRRGIVHRDLKPGNVAVTNGKVKVLDFGLSAVREQASESNEVQGTLAYMAPEVLMGSGNTELSDLYAVGVMAYELFLGVHPSKGKTATELINNILTVPPNLENLNIDPDLAVVLGRLLAKNPSDRYASASEVIHALCAAVDREVPPETAAIRESFLQAAKLVGRNQELNHLSQVLREAVKGTGSTWIVGGESGVGKSRLMDELRTLALVQGALVIRGQAISESGGTYQIWRDTFRWLALAQPTDFEASVLKAVVPDISSLLGRDVDDPPELDPQATQDRLLTVVQNILLRTITQEQGFLIVLLLEDIHWADGESLKILRRFITLTHATSLLILGTYRDDERPDLPATLPGIHILKLERLTQASIAELSASMLGATGHQKQVIDLLQRETEGNVFFLVEVVRTLAEEAGNLDDVGLMTLPDSVFAGGMQRIVQRRLEHVPAYNRALLQIAAVIGRQLDLAVLKQVNLVKSLDNWLNDCADVAVLDVQDGRWRFAHDKLREGLLADLPPAEKRVLHQQVAEAIEAVYPNAPDQHVALAYHWEMAGNLEKTRHYCALTGEQALANGANKNAVEFLERAIALYNGSSVKPTELAAWERSLGEAYYGLGRMPQSYEHLAHAVDLLGYPVSAAGLPRILGIVRHAGSQALHRFLPSLFIGRSGHQKESLMEAAGAYERIAEIMYFRNHMFGTVFSALATLNISEKASDKSPEMMRAFSTNSVVITLLHLHPLARSYGRLARKAAQVVNHPQARQWVLMLEGMNYEIVGDWEKSEKVQLEAIDASLNIGSAKRWSESTYQLAYLKYYRGQFSESYNLWRDMASAARDRGDLQAMVWGLQGQLISSIPMTLSDDSLTELEKINLDEVMDWDAASLINVYAGIATVRLRRKEYDLAQDAAEKGLKLIQQTLPTSYFTLAGYAGITETWVKLWERAAADSTSTPDELRQLRRNAISARDSSLNFTLLFSIAQPFSLRWRGLCQWVKGNHDKAHRVWQKALKVADDLDMPYEKALTLYEIARHMPADTAAHQEYMGQARKVFEQLGAATDLEGTQPGLAIEWV